MLKDDARKHYRSLRDALSEGERARIDAAIAERVCRLPDFERATAVFTYLSVGAEVDTREIIRKAWSAGKTVAVPRCVPGTNRMNWHRLEDFEHLEQGSFGIEEPPDDAKTLVEAPRFGTQGEGRVTRRDERLEGREAVSGSERSRPIGREVLSAEQGDSTRARVLSPAIAIVPGYSFDMRGFRLGYGGGFYDVFLPGFDGASMGLCRACQLSFDPLPCDPHDIPVDMVITENRTLIP